MAPANLSFAGTRVIGGPQGLRVWPIMAARDRPAALRAPATAVSGVAATSSDSSSVSAEWNGMDGI
jgi:hypothetical protein